MPKAESSREVPVNDVLNLVEAALDAIQRKRIESRDRQIKARIEKVNRRLFRRLFRLKPWDWVRGAYWFETGMYDEFVSVKKRNNWLFWEDEHRLKELKALCTTFQTKEFIAITARDAELLSSWSNP